MKKLVAGEVSLFCDQLGIALRVGLPIQQSLEMMEEEILNEEIRQIITLLIKHLQEEGALDQAMEKVKVFPAYSIQMVKVGFEAGKLEEVLARLKMYYEKEELFRRNVKRAITYPLLLVGMVCVVIWVMSAQVLPVFREVLESLGADLSKSARVMMKAGEIMTLGMLGGIGGVCVCLTSLWVYIKVSGKQEILYSLLEHSQIYRYLAMERFWSAMELMVSSGMDMEYAVGLATTSIGHKGMSEKLREAEAGIRAGKELVNALEETKLFGVLTITLLRMGVRTGYLEESLSKLAQLYEIELEERLEGWLGRIEPTVIILLAGMVGGILMTVMIPLMSILSAIG